MNILLRVNVALSFFISAFCLQAASKPYLPPVFSQFAKPTCSSAVNQFQALALESGLVDSSGLVNDAVCDQWIKFAELIDNEFAPRDCMMPGLSDFVKNHGSTATRTVQYGSVLAAYYALYLAIETIVSNMPKDRYNYEDDKITFRVFGYLYGGLFVTLIAKAASGYFADSAIALFLKYFGDPRPNFGYRLAFFALDHVAEKRDIPESMKPLFAFLATEVAQVRVLSGMNLSDQEATYIVRAIITVGGLAYLFKTIKERVSGRII